MELCIVDCNSLRPAYCILLEIGKLSEGKLYLQVANTNSKREQNFNNNN